MKKIVRTLGLASILLTGIATAGFAAGTGDTPSQRATGNQPGNPQVGTPTTGSRAPTPGTTYSNTNRTSPQMTSPGSVGNDNANDRGSSNTGGTGGAAGGTSGGTGTSR
jgi:hypothetical protein